MVYGWWLVVHYLTIIIQAFITFQANQIKIVFNVNDIDLNVDSLSGFISLKESGQRLVLNEIELTMYDYLVQVRQFEETTSS